MEPNKLDNCQPIKETCTFGTVLNLPQPYNELNRLQNTEEMNLDNSTNETLQRIQGSIIGLAVGDALGASVEFRPNSYMKSYPVTEMQDGGTWGLQKGQWTDDTSMALCLAASLIVKGTFNGYDQLVRYKRWFRNGYMSSTGTCFDIGASTRQAIIEFEKRQRQWASKLRKDSGMTISENNIDQIIGDKLSQIDFDEQCGESDANGNGPLMRLAPIPLFYFQSEADAVHYAGISAGLTHGGKQAMDACRFYSALIWNAVNGMSKKQLLDKKFSRRYSKHRLDEAIMEIAEGSYKTKDGYEGGIRGKGYIVNALEAALWAFYNDEDSFEKGALLAVNLGDDTDTTAAIYGQLAGAVYGIDKIPERWRNQLSQKDFLITLANGLYLKGKSLKGLKRGSEVVENVESNDRPAKKKTEPVSNKSNVTESKL